MSLLSQREESVGEELEVVHDFEVPTKWRLKEFNARKQFESFFLSFSFPFTFMFKNSNASMYLMAMCG